MLDVDKNGRFGSSLSTSSTSVTNALDHQVFLLGIVDVIKKYRFRFHQLISERQESLGTRLRRQSALGLSLSNYINVYEMNINDNRHTSRTFPPNLR